MLYGDGHVDIRDFIDLDIMVVRKVAVALEGLVPVLDIIAWTLGIVVYGFKVRYLSISLTEK